MQNDKKANPSVLHFFKEFHQDSPLHKHKYCQDYSGIVIA